MPFVSLWLQNETLDALLDCGDVEVDEESEAFLGELHIREELGGEDGVHGLHGFELTDDEVVDQDMEPEAFVEGDVAVDDGYHHLPGEGEAAVGKLAAEADFVDVLQQARAEGL